MRWTRILLGGIMVVAGGTWFLQGIGVLPGSFMSHSTTWVIIGGVVVVAGAVLLREAFRPGGGR